jgi:serine/threonine-protein kinase
MLASADVEPKPETRGARSGSRIKPGAMIGEKYRVERELGRGGFGIVVRAMHLALDERVAIKILTDAGSGEADWREDAARFQREAQATAALKGEHVVRIHDVDVLPEGLPYIVMEYLDGETLHHVVHTRAPLPVDEAVDILVQVLAALAEAHAAGIVHRDLKPANVFLTKGKAGLEIAKVLDFGASKSDVHGAAGQSLTRTGALIGTAAYMAPEQMVDAKRVDARADIWSAGVILYELLSKKLPFGAPTDPTTAAAVLTKPPLPLSVARWGLPPVLAAAIMRCLEKDPSRRFESAADLGAALAPFGTTRSRAALAFMKSVGAPARLAAPPRPRGDGRWLLVPIACLGVGLAIGIGVGALFFLRARTHPTPAAPSAGASALPSRR